MDLWNGSPVVHGGLVTYLFFDTPPLAIKYLNRFWKKVSNMPRKKIAAGQEDSPQVASKKRKNLPFYKGKDLPFYYEYITPDGEVLLLDEYEWSSGMGISHTAVKRAQASRKREVRKGFAETKEA